MQHANCPSCAAPITIVARFCSACGTPVAALPPRPAAHQRILTVLFADMVGSTRFAREAGLEEYDAALRRFHDLAAGIVVQFSGTVVQAYGDGILAAFGTRKDGEDAAIAGVAAGLALVDATRTALPRVALRIGVHSGSVMRLERSAGPGQPQITGYDVNLAARLQETASPGGVVVSAATAGFLRRLTRVTVRREGLVELKGIAQPVAFAEVEAIELIAQTAQAAPLLERQDELDRIAQGRFDPGREAGFALVGPAGIGKSSLLGALMRHGPSPRDPILLTARANLANTPLFPAVEAARRTLGLAAGDDHAALVTALAARDIRPSPASIATISEALDLAGAPPHGLSPEAVAPHRIADLADLLAGLARAEGRAILFDDLHWADPQTRALLRRIAEDRVPALIVTGRDTPDMGEFLDVAALSRIDLAPLTDDAAGRLVDRHATLAPDRRASIVDRSAGNPLFLVALAEWAARLGDDAEAEDLPTTVEASLQAVIESFDGLKDLVLCASVLGRQVIPAHLRLIAGPVEQLDLKLDHLSLGGLLVKEEGGFSFGHILARDAAYRMLGERHLRDLHGALVRGLPAEDPAFCAAFPEILADHARAADDRPALAAASVEAGRKFLRQAEFDLAGRYLRDAQDAAPPATDGEAAPGAGSARLVAATLLASTQVQIKGFAHPDVHDSYRELDAMVARQRGSDPVRMYALYGLFAHRMIGGGVRACAPLVARMAGIAADGDPRLQILWRVNESALGLYSGRLDRSVAANAALRHLYDPETCGSMFLEVGADPLAAILSAEAHIHAQRADPAAARAAVAAAHAQVDRIGAKLQKPWIHVFGALALHVAGDGPDARAEVAQGITVADAQGARYWSLIGRMTEAVLQVFDGEIEAGAQVLDTFLPQAEAIGSRLFEPLYLGALARARLAQGASGEAERITLRATRRVATTGEGLWAGLAWSLRAEALAATGAQDASRHARRVAAAYRARGGLPA